MADKIEVLRARIERSFQGRQLREVLERYRAVVGPSRSEEQLVQEAIEALHNGKVPRPRQLAALEKAIRVFRPALFSAKGELPDLPDEATGAFPNWQKFRSSMKSFLYAIGRIDRCAEKPGNSDESVGTGFLISGTLLVTNKHVLWELSGGTGLLEPGQAVVRFGQEYKIAPDPKPASISIVRAVAAHPTLDLALLEVEPIAVRVGRLPLELDSRPPEEGDAVVTVGYPFPDTVRNPLFVRQVFGQTYGVKRAAPGEVTTVESPYVYHDCSTLGGNSGSPLLAMDTARVIAVHGRGGFTTRNEAIGARTVRTFLKPYLR